MGTTRYWPRLSSIHQVPTGGKYWTESGHTGTLSTALESGDGSYVRLKTGGTPPYSGGPYLEDVAADGAYGTWPVFNLHDYHAGGTIDQLTTHIRLRVAGEMHPVLRPGVVVTHLYSSVDVVIGQWGDLTATSFEDMESTFPSGGVTTRVPLLSGSPFHIEPFFALIPDPGDEAWVAVDIAELYVDITTSPPNSVSGALKFSRAHFT